MTTETKLHRSGGVVTLLGAASFSLCVGLVLVAVVAIAGGPASAAGAGVVLGLAVLAFGAFAVDAVAGIMPAASLLVALMTYVLQLALMTLVLVAASRSDALAGEGRGSWLVAGVIASVLAWTLAQLVLATRRRIPAYDIVLPSEKSAVIDSAFDRVSVR